MSELEKKSKSAIQIAYDYFSLPQKIDNSPWVPLTEAQNRIIDEQCHYSRAMVERDLALEKIEEANKILNEHPLPFGIVDDWKKVQSWLDRLKASLSIKPNGN